MRSRIGAVSRFVVYKNSLVRRPARLPRGRVETVARHFRARPDQEWLA
jgi:hypothetical protein